MRISQILMLAVLCLGGAASVQADIIFSDVQVDNDFGPYSVFSMSTTPSFDSLFFHFPEAYVGDDYEPMRSGSITVSFTVESEPGMALSAMHLRAVGDLEGLGVIEAEGYAQDLELPGVIASSSIILNNSLQFPYTSDATFSRTSARIRVSQTFDLSADPGLDLDLAHLKLAIYTIDQVPVPEAASLTLLALGAFAMMRRR